MSKELLLLGGSFMAPFIDYLKTNESMKNSSPYPIKAVACSDLDFCASVRLSPQGDIDCRGHAFLSRSCREAYGGDIIPFNPGRLICLGIGGWHHAVDDPIWKNHYPADLSPDWDQTTPLAINETVDRILPEIQLRVETARRFAETQNSFFVILVPPMIFRNAALASGIPPRTARYVNSLCVILFKRALERLGVNYLDGPGLGFDPNSFFKPEYFHKADDGHANAAYTASYWQSITEFLDRNKWQPDVFRKREAA